MFGPTLSGRDKVPSDSNSYQQRELCTCGRQTLPLQPSQNPKATVFIKQPLIPNNRGMRGKPEIHPNKIIELDIKRSVERWSWWYSPGPAACPSWKLLMPERDCLLVWGFDGKSWLYWHSTVVSQSFQGRCFPLFPWHWVVIRRPHHG